jgi:hypothetical protein
MSDNVFPFIMLAVIVLAANAARETLWIRSLKRTPEAEGLWLLHALYMTMATLTVSALYFAGLTVLRILYGPESTVGLRSLSIVAILLMLAVPTMLGRELRKRREDKMSRAEQGSHASPHDPTMRP